MRIGIDVRKIADSGIGSHIYNLIENLLKVEGSHEYILFFSPEDIERYEYPLERVTKVVDSSKKYSIGEHWSLPAKAKKYGIDLFHAPHYTLPRFYKGKSVVTIHDIIHLLDRSFRPLERAYANWMIGSAISRADAIITVSDYTKRALIEMLNAPEEKIRVIPNGGGANFSRPGEGVIDAELAREKINGEFYLFVGSDRPHKNLKAVASLLDGMDQKERFLIIGRVSDEIQREYAERFGERVIFRNNVGHDSMAACYAGAKALLFPSYHEGFGLPPLEAMACGTPVVASNRSSIPEVVGSGAILIDPDDIRGMVTALEKIDSDKNFRLKLIESGYERVKHFSWEDMARDTFRVYEEVAL